MLDKLIHILHYIGLYQRVNGKVQKVRGTVNKVQAAVKKHPEEYQWLGNFLLESVRERNKQKRCRK